MYHMHWAIWNRIELNWYRHSLKCENTKKGKRVLFSGVQIPSCWVWVSIIQSIHNEFQNDAIVFRSHAIDTMLKIKINDQWRASPYERRGNSFFSAFLNWSNDGYDVIHGDRLFQTFAAATVKARSPIVLWFDCGTWSSAVSVERSRVRELMSTTRCNPSARICGAVPLR